VANSEVTLLPAVFAGDWQCRKTTADAHHGGQAFDSSATANSRSMTAELGGYFVYSDSEKNASTSVMVWVIL
jgi:hypothetical protein